ncbi:MAG: hypothetical protein WCJ66_15620 [Verrucomicrobiota bacterium]
MSDSSERLTAAALQPFAETPELRSAATKMLEKMVPESHPDAATVIARWEVVAARKQRRSLWEWALALALVWLSVPVLLHAVAEGLHYRQVLRGDESSIGGRMSEPDAFRPHADMLAGLSEKEKFRLFGDLSKPTKTEQIRALWDSASDDPGCFAAYAINYRGDHGEYPPDFLATARRLDPGNAWFTYLAAGELASQAVKSEIQTSQARRAGELRSWKITDEAKLDEALALLRVANQQASCVNRKTEFVAARMPSFRQDDQLARWELLVYLIGDINSESNLRHLNEAIAAKAWLVGGSGDASQFKPLLTDADQFLQRVGAMENPSIIHALVHKSNAFQLTQYLQSAAEKLGLDEDAARLGKIKQRFDQWRATKKGNGNGTDAIRMHSGLYIQPGIFYMHNLAKNPPPLADEDLQPGRMIDHLLAARACSLVLWLLLGLALLAVALYRFCLPQAVLGLAQHMNALLMPVDWAWIFGAGLLLPFGYVTALTRLTPLGGQAWGLKALYGMLPAADFLAMGLLLLVVPALIARWRLGRRAAALGVCPGPARLSWLAVAAGLAFVPLFGLMTPPFESIEARVVWRAILLVPLLLVIFSSMIRALAVSFSRQLSRAAVALTLIPAYASAMLLLVASMPVYQVAQASWQKQEKMGEVMANGGLHCESAVAEEILKEVGELLGRVED